MPISLARGGLSEQCETRLGLQNRQDRIDCFLDPDCLHAAEIDWAFSEEARAAFDVMSQNNVVIGEWSGETRLGRAKNRHHRNSKERSETHCAGVIRQQYTAFAQGKDELIERGLTNSIYTGIAESGGDLLANFRIFGCSEKNPPHWRLCGDSYCRLRESLRKPSFRRSVFCTGTETNFERLKVDSCRLIGSRNLAVGRATSLGDPE